MLLYLELVFELHLPITYVPSIHPISNGISVFKGLWILGPSKVALIEKLA